jgi:beta-fructofuranosidase
MKKHCIVLFSLLLWAFSALAQEESETRQDLIVPGQPVPEELIMSVRSFRERLLSDPYRPAFHFCIPEGNGMPGDPNGAFFANGRYHLMYLYNRAGSGFSWGHISSSDLVHWRHHPDAIGPGDGDDGCFSGGAFVDEDGTAYLSYWMLWGDKGIGLARSNDLHYDRFVKFGNNPVIKSDEWGITNMTDAEGKPFYIGSSDPSNIWKKGDKYYMLTGNLLVLRKYGSRGAGLPADMPDGPPLPGDSLNYQGDWLDLFESENLKDWTYRHRFYERNPLWTEITEDNMCPSFLPLPLTEEGGPASGKHLLLFISHNLGCQYYVGNYTNDRFYPDNHGRMTWNDNAYFAPEALTDDKGRQIMWAWIFDDRPDSVKSLTGWTGMYGLPRSLWLGNDGALRMAPVKELAKLRINPKIQGNITLQSEGEVRLEGTGTELMELEIVFDDINAREMGVKVCMSEDGSEETVISYDREAKS